MAAADFSPAFTQLIGNLQTTYPIDASLHTERTKYEDDRYEKAFFMLEDFAYLLVLKNNRYVTFSVQKPGEIAYSIAIEKKPVKRALTPIHRFISAQQKQQTYVSAATSGHTSLSQADPNNEQQSSISTANVLSWNRLLRDAYQGNVGSSMAGASAQSQGDSDYGQAISMAKIMNQCGNNKSTQAHKQAMQNIAQALVMSSAKPSNSHQVARASESYADQSKDYQKHGKESILETLQNMRTVDVTALFQQLQAEKRKIERGLQRNEISYIFTDHPSDQNALSLLKTMIKKHSRIKTLTQFQYIGRKLIIDDQYFEQFAAEPSKAFIYIPAKRTWAINPLLQSNLQYRKALIEILSSHINS